MSIIAGVQRRSGRESCTELCGRMLRALADYGREPVAVRQVARVAFGGVVASDSQPGKNSGRWLIAADARLDNRFEIRARLGSRLESKNTDDISLLLHAWMAWGPASLDLLVGEYALAIYDCQEEAAYLARDGIGERPLFYSESDDGFAFASMPSGLRAIGHHPPSPLSLAAELEGQPLDDATIFAGIKRVPSGEYVRLSAEPTRRVRHWRPIVGTRSGSRNPEASATIDFVEQYRHLLDESVACRLPSETAPIASQLSSGWDSSAVTTTAARLRPGSVIALTSAPLSPDLSTLPRGRIADESALAAVTARRYDLDHIVVRDNAPLFEVVRRQSLLAQSPAINAFNLGWWEKTRLIAQQRGATHLLTGELGNLTLNAGGLMTLSEWVRRSMWRTWWREARAAALRSDVRWRGILINSFGYRLPSGSITELRKLFLKMPAPESVSFLRKEWREQLDQQAASEPSANGDPYRERFDAICHYDAGVIRKAAFAQARVEELDPTADRRLVEFSLALPPDRLFHNGQSRPLAREALSDRVPAEILNLNFRGLQSADWYLRVSQREAFEVMEEIAPVPAVRELLDVNAMQRAIAAWPDRDWNSASHLATYRTSLIGALATGIFITQFADQAR